MPVRSRSLLIGLFLVFGCADSNTQPLSPDASDIIDSGALDASRSPQGDAAQSAECLVDGDCSDDELCIRRSCTPQTPCDNSLDCVLGAVCDPEDGRCVECVIDNDCDDGFKCAAHVCRSQCDSDVDCQPLQMLCARELGYCVVPGDDPDPASDGGPAPDACTGTTPIGVTRLIPTVMVVLDGSTSMLEPYGPIPLDDAGAPDPTAPAPPTRWTAVREALVDATDGVVPTLQNEVRFGLAVFGTMPSCPLPLGIVEPVAGNASAIASAIPVDMPPGTFTPTGAALDAVIDQLPDSVEDTSVGPQVIVLATDGDPNGCEVPEFIPVTDFAPSLAAARKASAKHIKLLVVSVGSDAAAAHLQEMANLGAGLASDASPGARVYYPSDATELSSELRSLVMAQLTCDFALDTAIDPGEACTGQVSLNGSLLPCDSADGWSLLDPTHIRLSGAACDALAGGTATVQISFPCDVVEP